MSFILDALKKSEAERQRHAGPALLEMRVVPPRRGLPLWAVGLALLLLVNLGVLGWLALRTPGAPARVATAAAPTGSLPGASLPAAAATGPAPGAPLAAAWPGNGAVAPQAAAATSLPPLAGSVPAPGRTASASRPAEEPEENPADTAPAVAAPPGAAPSGKGLQNYVAISSTLPALRLDLHAWAELPAERYALINMHRVREGDTLPEGPRVQQITRDGVVLDYRGTEFLLGRE
jgi:general secretion pathway protein B